jgi:hypothetical protein
MAERRYLAFDVADALSPFMVDDWPDEERFWKTGISLMTRAAAAARCEPPGVVAAGEVCPTLLRNGQTEAAIRVERLWDELGRMFNVEVWCPYLTAGLQYDATSDVLQRISEQHSAASSR